MFDVEAELATCRHRKGPRHAIELVADIADPAALRSPSDDGRRRGGTPALKGQRCVLDLNEHFLELSNMGEESRVWMLLANLAVILASAISTLVIWTQTWQEPAFSPRWLCLLALGGGCGLLQLAYFWLGWSTLVAPCFFTALRARYRFNRTTGKVYVLRPVRFGGNVILDWERVRAHVRWCAPRQMKHYQLRDPVAREARQTVRRSLRDVRGLVLYWPPHDPKDPARVGEDVLWVGPNGAGRHLWEYIRLFMAEGMDQVPPPLAGEWLRKGPHTAEQHVAEQERPPRRGPPDLPLASPPPIGLRARVHSMAERLCHWPSFPVEWNSDCGRRRREHGIGPEEPLRWEPK